MDFEAQRELVEEHLAKRNIINYTITKGNDCVWVNYRRGQHSMNDYYIVRDNKIVDIIAD